MNDISFHVIHPSFEKLKHSGRLLHLLAAIILLAHALGHLRESYNPVYFWCQLIFAIDILLLIFAGRNLALSMPGINGFFRFIEVLFFIGIGVILFFETKWIQGSFHLLLGCLYAYLFCCERKLRQDAILNIYHSGISLPGLPSNKFLFWTQINRLTATYDCVEIETVTNGVMKLNFRYNLSFDELDQIHEFCRYYLGV